MNPAALVFDAYGTLFDVHAVVQRGEAFWPGKGAQLSALWRAKQLEWTWQRSLMRRYLPFSQLTRDALAYACEALGLACDDARAGALMDEYRRLATYADVPDALAQLHAEGYKLAILTNGSPDMIVPLVAHHGMQSLFDAVLSVDELKIYKPAPEVYRLAAKRLGLPSNVIGFISSNGWDALGAKSFGLRAWWINRGGAPLDRLGFAPDGLLAGLGELPHALAA
ncbi:MAG: haloacid dehalogenase type II [Betaproteobacteria bacterium]|nr:MAG: haloacid dehalogenase type II [Betaproteobacteria bacterium]